jgi:hypothetical protein
MPLPSLFTDGSDGPTGQKRMRADLRRAAADGVSQAKNRVFLFGDLHTSNATK